MPETRRCPRCAAEIPANIAGELCPSCLLQLGLQSDPATGARPAEPATEAASPSPATFVPPSVAELSARLPQFEILALLGRGGMGAVYKARQAHLDRLVAVKILSPEVSHDPAFAERFAREARALARLNHPHIVGVHDFGQVDGLYYLVMEYVDGVNLRTLLTDKSLPPANALSIVPQICEALQFAHDEGIVHRDIKPENILIDKRGRVKIADFGLAKLTASGERASPDSLTATHQVMGTLRYMAPEQMEGSKQVDHRADIYSLGVVFYELLTGELPLGRFAPPSRKVEIDVRLDEVVLRALEKDPGQRWQQASEVKTEVESISRSTPPPAAPPARPEAAPQAHKAVGWLSWKRLLAIWAGAIVLLTIIAALLPTAKFTSYRKLSVFVPKSGAYPRLALGGKFQSVERLGIVTNLRPDRWVLEIEIPDKNFDKTVRREIPLPIPAEIKYDFNLFLNEGPKFDASAATKAEIERLRFFVENYFSTPENLPASWDEFHQRAVQALAPNFADGGFDMSYHGVQQVNLFWPVVLGGTGLLTAALILILGRQGYFAGVLARLRSLDSPAVLRWGLFAAWTIICIALYVWLWFPVHPHLGRPWPEPIGLIDRWHWPYQGELTASVTLIPKEKTFRQLTITNHRKVTRWGFENGHSYYWLGPGHRGERMLDDYTVELVDVNGRKAPFSLTINGLKGLRWYYGSNPDNSMRNGSSFNVEDALDWLRDCKVTGDEAKLREQTKAWVEVLLHAANDSGNVIYWKGPRQPVGHLAYIVGQDAHSANSFGRGDFPWEDYVGTDDRQFGPVVPIAYVGVPLMITVWGAGLLLLWRIRRRQSAAHNVNAPNADQPNRPPAPDRGNTLGRLMGYGAALVLVLSVLAIVWATVGWPEAAVWASLTWLAVHGLVLWWLPQQSKPMPATARALFLTSWTLACTAVFFTLWLPDPPRTSTWAKALGYLERFYWPYDGKSNCSVTLIPVDKTFRQLTIVNERAIRRYGVDTRSVINWSGPGWPGERTRDIFTVSFTRTDGKQAQPLVFDGIGKQTWSYTEFDSKKKHEMETPLTVDGAIEWLKANGVDVAAADHAALAKQTKFWIDLLLLAASQDDASGGYRGAHRCVGYLDFFVGREQLAWELKAGGADAVLPPGPLQFPWTDHFGTHEYSFAPAVPILWVGLPLMLMIWLIGMLVIRAVATENTAANAWRRLPHSLRLGVHILLAIVYCSCLLLFFSYSISSSTASHRFTIGQPSPWFEHHSGSGGFGTSLHFFTWSNLMALIGIASLMLSRKLEYIERGKVHSLAWHVGLWAVLLVIAVALGVFSGELHELKTAQGVARRRQ